MYLTNQNFTFYDLISVLGNDKTGRNGWSGSIGTIHSF